MTEERQPAPSSRKQEERKGKSLEEIAEMVGVGRFETHLFICSGPDCCDPETGGAAWKAVKREVKHHNPDMREARVYRTRVNCLRICKGGPIAVAYPQGKWFGGVTADEVPGLVEWLQAGAPGKHPLEFAEYPLPPNSASED